ncbi:HAD family hydrolase [Flavobacterium sp. SUN052]|uniref:HAD family hydrolase n=1 Tax=Flavobacterium sp. SUN052 TaxID=3002441 RepID=UPI00237D490D|nr:HAD family hydrolase [Flavobacterium sp. SUN052]MEC4005376.1 HAD family hydrolase [Flavobacterium sp. SUN052]
MNNIKLIVSDLDGTLLDSNHQLPPDFWQVEQQLRDKNIIFAIATGRQFYNIIQVFDKIKDTTLFLAENGTYGFYNGKEIFVNPLPMEKAIEFVKIGRTIENAYPIICGKNAAYVENSEERFLTEVRKYYSKLEIVSDLTQVKDDVLKVTFCDFQDVPTNSYLYFKEFSNEFKIAISGTVWLDITGFSANKGVAIETIQKQLNISFDETMVFGDFLNDYEMMQTAKYSFAMKNAHPDIVAISNYQTKLDNNNNGVTETIKEFLL